MALPEWISEVDAQKGIFAVDPDVFYPQFMSALGIDDPTQYDLELCFACMKLDFDLHVRMMGRQMGRVMRLVRSDDGRKLRWNKSMFPKGGEDWDALPAGERARRAREAYRRIRGFVPG